ncbi:MAG: HAMP domain-containing histidine kinase [Gammaproteobacteria bacterium]|nr:HAMP domain-containing histidine kinase [Gammaproteobacteria bacterium]
MQVLYNRKENVVEQLHEQKNIVLSARLLIVDNDADTREYLANLLAERWIVETTSAGAVALEMLRQKKFDLVLADITLPVSDGFGLLQALRADPILQNIPIIRISTRAEIEEKIAALAIEADDYLVKPFSAKEVFARVDTHLKLASRHYLVAENEILRKEKEKAEKNNYQKDVFLATLSHELKTPISAIICWVQALKKQCHHMKRITRALESIEESAFVQNRLINDLLDISSIILGKISIELKEVDLIHVIESSIDSFKSSLENKNIQFIFKSSITKLIMQLDADRIRQVFCNLLSNAIKFTPIGGRIEMLIEENEEALQIIISDTGQGITAELLPHIFERFTQACTSYSRSQEGLGLGLYLTKNFLELQGGSITATSLGLNKGTSFSIVFKK